MGDQKTAGFSVKHSTSGPTQGHKRHKNCFCMIHQQATDVLGAPIENLPDNTVHRVLSLDKGELVVSVKSNLQTKQDIDFAFTQQKFSDYNAELQAQEDIDQHTLQLLRKECEHVLAWARAQNDEVFYLQYIMPPGNWDASMNNNRDQRTEFYVSNNLHDTLSMKTKNKKDPLHQNPCSVNTNALRDSMYTDKSAMLEVTATQHSHFNAALPALNSFLRSGFDIASVLTTGSNDECDLEHVLTTFPTRLCHMVSIGAQCMQMCDGLLCDLTTHIGNA
jgi:hypothetical protein